MKKCKIFTRFIFWLSLLAACNNSIEEKEAPQNVADEKTTETKTVNTLFEKKTSSQTAINFENTINDNINGRFNALTFQYIFNGGGVGVADINNDGLQDIYFTGNMVPDELYLNKGNFKFENISKTAGIQTKGWSNGVSFVDINNDGWLDIYVCKGGPEVDANIKQNKLFINQQNNTFKEAAKQYGLADNRISTQAAFFDYDNDGDLDCFVMNNAVYKSGRVHENQERLKTDKTFLLDNTSNLYQNNNGQFSVVTAKAGLADYSYGLGLLIQDFNEDNLPDIYIANDYYVPDKMYINNGNGTFTDQIRQRTRQTSFYSMGIDAADFNNDGLTDITVLDMSSNDHVLNKTLMPSMNVNLFYTLVAHYGFQYQYMFNSLQLNMGNGRYSNVAQMAGIASTEWSWSVLAADYDLDGLQDLHITNGLKKYLSDNDFRTRIKALNAKANAGQTISSQEKHKLYNSMPTHKIENILFKNNAGLTFNAMQAQWGINEKLNSNGAAYADLDNDGDLDLIINNIDAPASILENKATNQNNFITIDVDYNNMNTVVEIYSNEVTQTKEYHPVRGYQSSQDHRLNFGLAKAKKADSIIVKWNKETYTKLINVEANQFLKIRKEKTFYINTKNEQALFKAIDATKAGISFKHKENKYNDYKSEVLLPYLQSTLGPKISKADINKDDLDDFYIGGAAGQAGELYIQQQNKTFKKVQGPWIKDAACEDMGSLFFDADSDGDLDLYVCSGGNAFDESNAALIDRLYINNGNLSFVKFGKLPNIKRVTNVATAADFDDDGDVDLFIGGRHQPQKYPLSQASYFLINNNGNFTFGNVLKDIAQAIGMVNDACFVDIDADEDQDLIVATEWGPIHILENKNGNFSNENKKWNTTSYTGWWQALLIEDIDNDNDLDIIAGNLGSNSKFKASKEKPFKIFAGDFDQNGTHDLFLSKKYKENYVPVRGLQCASEQMPALQQQFSSYQSFATSSIHQILGGIENQSVFECTTFQSGIFINQNNSFTFQPLPNMAQISPILAIQSIDINNNGLIDIIIAGNIYNTEPETPRLDALSAQLLINKGKCSFQQMSKTKSGLDVFSNVKHAKLLQSKNSTMLIYGVNNNKIFLYHAK